MIAGYLYRCLALANLKRVAILVGLLRVDGGGVAAAHHVAPLAAHGLDIDFLVGVAGEELEGGFENVRVECAGKALVAADDDQQNPLLGPSGKERMAQIAGLRVNNVDAAGGGLQHARGLSFGWGGGPL